MSSEKSSFRKPVVEALIQARMNSSRLPGKVLMDLGGMPAIMQVVRRVEAASTVDKVAVLTSLEASDDALEKTLKEFGVRVFRGSLDNVLDRFIKYIDTASSDVYLRITGDCPLIDPDLIDQTVRFHIEGGWDYTSNTLRRTFPRGLDVEVFNSTTLKNLTRSRLALSAAELEHVTLGIYGNPGVFKIGSFFKDVDNSRHRWTLDTIDDFIFLSWLFETMPEQPRLGMGGVLSWLESHPERARFEIQAG
jgi:spore coat polysaccharide biosynthesis protein SpsF